MIPEAHPRSRIHNSELPSILIPPYNASPRPISSTDPFVSPVWGDVQLMVAPPEAKRVGHRREMPLRWVGG